MTQEKETQTTLREALVEFVASPRFNFLKSLKVGPILGEDSATLGEVSDMTFEQLTHSLEDHTSELHRLTTAQERLLVAVLRALSEGDGARGDETVDEASSSTTFNSVQCELELRERISRLKANPNLSSIIDLQVGQFWASGEMRAPFEESFTVKQLLGLDLAVLAKKRSMTSGRMLALARALENAEMHLSGGHGDMSGVAEHPLSSVLTEIAQRSLAIPPPTGFEAHPTTHRWTGTYQEKTLPEKALIEVVIQSERGVGGVPEIIQDAVAQFCEAFTAQELLDVVGGRAISQRTVRALQRWANESSLKSSFLALKGSVQGPGVHISRLAGLIISGGNSTGVIDCLVATLLVRALGALEVTLHGRVCREVWTTNPALVSLIAREASSKRKVGVSKALRATCPDLDPILHSWLCEVVPLLQGGKKRR